MQLRRRFTSFSAKPVAAKSGMSDWSETRDQASQKGNFIKNNIYRIAYVEFYTPESVLLAMA